MRKKANEVAYLQIYRTLREHIVRGDYPYGTRLPSKRALAAEHGVSVITAEHAYAVLCDEVVDDLQAFRRGYSAEEADDNMAKSLVLRYPFRIGEVLTSDNAHCRVVEHRDGKVHIEFCVKS